MILYIEPSQLLSWWQLSGVCSHDRSVLYFLWSIIDEDLFPSQVEKTMMMMMRMTMFIWEYWNNSIRGVHECWALQQRGERGSHCRFYGRTCSTELHWVSVIINVIMVVVINVIMIVVINVIIDQDKTTVLPRHLRLPLGLWWAQHLALCLISTRKKKLNFWFKWIVLIWKKLW